MLEGLGDRTQAFHELSGGAAAGLQARHVDSGQGPGERPSLLQQMKEWERAACKASEVMNDLGYWLCQEYVGLSYKLKRSLKAGADEETDGEGTDGEGTDGEETGGEENGSEDKGGEEKEEKGGEEKGGKEEKGGEEKGDEKKDGEEKADEQKSSKDEENVEEEVIGGDDAEMTLPDGTTIEELYSAD
ncbi:MAG: hypothetical protein Q9183_007475 [Haloplaca sp. 2 TL-2023]